MWIIGKISRKSARILFHCHYDNRMYVRCYYLNNYVNMSPLWCASKLLELQSLSLNFKILVGGTFVQNCTTRLDFCIPYRHCIIAFSFPSIQKDINRTFVIVLLVDSRFSWQNKFLRNGLCWIFQESLWGYKRQCCNAGWISFGEFTSYEKGEYFERACV